MQFAVKIAITEASDECSMLRQNQRQMRHNAALRQVSGQTMAHVNITTKNITYKPAVSTLSETAGLEDFFWSEAAGAAFAVSSTLFISASTSNLYHHMNKDYLSQLAA